MHRHETVANQRQHRINLIHNSHQVLITISNKLSIHWIRSKAQIRTVRLKRQTTGVATMEHFWPVIRRNHCTYITVFIFRSSIKLTFHPFKLHLSIILIIFILSFTHTFSFFTFSFEIIKMKKNNIKFFTFFSVRFWVVVFVFLFLFAFGSFLLY